MFCERCGTKLNNNICPGKKEDGSACGFIKYFNPIPVVVGLIPVVVSEEPWEVKLLGIRRGEGKGVGQLAFPGGFLEYEDVKAALLREIKEETGLDLLSLLDKDKFPNSYPVGDNGTILSIPNNKEVILFFKTMKIKKSDVNFNYKTKEILEVVLIDRTTPLAFKLHELVRDRFYGEVDFYEQGHHLV